MRFGQPEKRPRAQRTRGKAAEQPAAAGLVRPLQPAGLLEESRISFDAVDGHAHDGSSSHAISLAGDVTGTNTAAVVAKLQGVPIAAPAGDDDGQFPRYNSGSGTITWEPPSHTLLSATHTDTTVGTVARGDLVAGQGASPKFARLALGASGTVLRSNGTDVAWSTDTHNLLSTRHADTTAEAVARGDVITGQGASPTWKRLAVGLAGRYLRSDGTDLAWGQVAFSELAGSLSTTQHGALGSGASHTLAGDVSGTTAAATVDKLKGKAVTTPSSAGTYAKYDGSGIVWDTPSPGVSNHALLSSVHTDVTAASPTRGDLITAQGASPTWSRLALGTSGRVLRSNGTDAAWAQLSHADLDPATVSPNQHHNQAHLFFGSDHSDVSGSPGAGAIIYRNGSSQWVPLAAGSTDQILKVNGSGLPTWAAANSVATSRAPVYGWRRSNISTGASTSLTEMPGFDAVNTGERMAYAGTIVGIAVVLDGDVGGSLDKYTVECFKATTDVLGSYVATGVTCTIAGGSGMERSASASGFSVPFNAGDILTVFDKKEGSVNGRSAKCHLLVVFS